MNIVKNEFHNKLTLKMYIRQESGHTGKVKISSNIWTYFANYNHFLVSSEQAIGKEKNEMQKVLS